MDGKVVRSSDHLLLGHSWHIEMLYIWWVNQGLKECIYFAKLSACMFASQILLLSDSNHLHFIISDSYLPVVNFGLG